MSLLGFCEEHKMKSSDLKQGHHYEIEYQENIPVAYSPKASPKLGYGRLMKLHCRRGWHSFKLNTGQIVYASSRSVLSPCPVASIFLTNETIIDDDEVSAEVKRLRKLGADDDARKQEVMEIVTYLSGLGVDTKTDDDFTSVTIPYLGIAQLKAALTSIYAKALSID
jgi:hypothetical protein